MLVGKERKRNDRSISVLIITRASVTPMTGRSTPLLLHVSRHLDFYDRACLRHSLMRCSSVSARNLKQRFFIFRKNRIIQKLKRGISDLTNLHLSVQSENLLQRLAPTFILSALNPCPQTSDLVDAVAGNA